MMKIIKVENNEYELVKEYKDGFLESDFLERYTDFFQDYDYIFGDYSYDKLRLKGFYEKHHKNVRKMNDIAVFDTYIKDYCAFGAKYFLLKKSNKVL